MAIRAAAIVLLTRLLGAGEAIQVIQLARKMDTLERKQVRKLRDLWEKINAQAFESLAETGRLPEREIQDAILDYFVEHAFTVAEAAIKSTGARGRLAAPKKAPARAVVPRSMNDLMRMWDLYRKRRVVPKRQADLARRVKAAYIKKVESIWFRYSEPFRKGDAATQEDVRRKFMEQAGTTFARAKTITETETTVYYNAVRRDIYDASPDVTHYLYVPVRDFATTAWCFDGRRPGAKGRGRGGLVFQKGTKLLEENTPAVHWNCRSELLPLTPQNPRHLALIRDASRRAENHTLEPLPKGWVSRRIAS